VVGERLQRGGIDGGEARPRPEAAAPHPGSHSPEVSVRASMGGRRTTLSSGHLRSAADATSNHDAARLSASSLFAWLISHQPAVLFSHNKPATSNQPAVLFSQNKSAPAISHQPNEQADHATGGGNRRRRRRRPPVLQGNPPGFG
jgi:hypothetical protein